MLANPTPLLPTSLLLTCADTLVLQLVDFLLLLTVSLEMNDSWMVQSRWDEPVNRLSQMAFDLSSISHWDRDDLTANGVHPEFEG